jgi:hypothetical protein
MKSTRKTNRPATAEAGTRSGSGGRRLVRLEEIRAGTAQHDRCLVSATNARLLFATKLHVYAAQSIISQTVPSTPDLMRKRVWPSGRSRTSSEKPRGRSSSFKSRSTFDSNKDCVISPDDRILAICTNTGRTMRGTSFFEKAVFISWGRAISHISRAALARK